MDENVAVDRIRMYLDLHGYTQSVSDIVRGYKQKHIEGYYISATTEWTVEATFNECKFLYDTGFYTE